MIPDPEKFRAVPDDFIFLDENNNTKVEKLKQVLGIK